MPQNINLDTKQPKNEISWPAYMGNVATSTAGGAIIGGAAGGVLGCLATVTDEALIHRDYTTKHYLSTTMLWSAVLVPFVRELGGIFPQYKLLLYGAGAVAIPSFAYVANDCLIYQEQIDEIIANLTPMVKLFDEDNIISRQEVKKLSTLLEISYYEAAKLLIKDLKYVFIDNLPLRTVIMTTFLDIIKKSIDYQYRKYVSHTDATSWAKTLITKNPTAHISEIPSLVLKGTGIYYGKKILDFVITRGQQALERDLTEKVESKIMYILTDPSTTNKSSAIPRIIEHIKGNIITLWDWGILQLPYITTQKMLDFAQFERVINIAPESLALQKITNYIPGLLNNYINKALNKYQSPVEDLTRKKEVMWDYIIYNLLDIQIINSRNFIQTRYKEIQQELETVEHKRELLTHLQSASLESLRCAFDCITTLYYWYKIRNKTTVENILVLEKGLTAVTSLLNGSVDPTNNSYFIGVREGVSKFMNALEFEGSNKQVKRETEGDTLIVEDYKLYKKRAADPLSPKEPELFITIADAQLTEDPPLKLKKPGRYAFSGPSGIGKTLLIRDIIGFLPAGFESSGKITLPVVNSTADNTKQKRILIDQKTLLPPGIKTLFEAITFKTTATLTREEKEDSTDKIIELLKQLNFYPQYSEDPNINNVLKIKLHEPNSKLHRDLSGGQEKKVALIRAILNLPELLILDEVFVGLDSESVASCQDVLEEKLPEALIIVIDHHAKANDKANNRGFYNSEIILTKDGYTINELNKGHREEPEEFFDAVDDIDDVKINNNTLELLGLNSSAQEADNDQQPQLSSLNAPLNSYDLNPDDGWVTLMG